MTAPVVFVDTETISLNRDHRHLWEIALIVPNYLEVVHPDGPNSFEAAEFSWFLKDVPLGEADSRALDVGRFHERYDATKAKTRQFVARQIAKLTWGAHLVGAVPSFDEERLWGLVRAHVVCPGWHYHLVDVEALVAGKLGVAPPWDSAELSRAVGVDPEGFEKHTALGDARWAKAIYEATVGGKP